MSSTVEIRFRPLAGTGPEYPSPGRALGALLSGAYRSGSDRALAAVHGLATAQQPSIEIPPSAGAFTTRAASAGNFSSDFGTSCGVSDVKSTYCSLTPGLSGSPQVSDHQRHHVCGDYVFRVDDDGVDLDVDGLVLAAEQVTAFGGGPELAVCSVSAEGTEKSESSTLWSYRPGRGLTRGRGRRLRQWSPELVRWYEEQYEAIFGPLALRSSFTSDSRLVEGTWVPQRPGPIVGDRRVIALEGHGFKQDRMPELLSGIEGGDPVPLVDPAGMVRGFSVLIGEPVSLDRSLPVAVMAPELATLRMSTWEGRGQKRRWVSATPVACGGDEVLLDWLLQRQLPEGFEVIGIDHRPWHQQHSASSPGMDRPRGHHLLWVEIVASATGMVRLGQLLDQGYGVMRPLPEGK